VRASQKRPYQRAGQGAGKPDEGLENRKAARDLIDAEGEGLGTSVELMKCQGKDKFV